MPHWQGEVCGAPDGQRWSAHLLHERTAVKSLTEPTAISPPCPPPPPSPNSTSQSLLSPPHTLASALIKGSSISLTARCLPSRNRPPPLNTFPPHSPHYPASSGDCPVPAALHSLLTFPPHTLASSGVEGGSVSSFPRCLPSASRPALPPRLPSPHSPHPRQLTCERRQRVLDGQVLAHHLLHVLGHLKRQLCAPGIEEQAAMRQVWGGSQAGRYEAAMAEAGVRWKPG
eukprot:350227-Chlamydomonas_euryale.AAC.3